MSYTEAHIHVAGTRSARRRNSCASDAPVVASVPAATASNHFQLELRHRAPEILVMLTLACEQLPVLRDTIRVELRASR